MLPNPFIIRLPSNAKWIIHFEDRGGRWWLGTGWGKFCTDVGIKPNGCIIWEYIPTHVFNVKVSVADDENQDDITGTEIEYPFPNDEDVLPNQEDPPALVQLSVLVKDNHLSSSKLSLPSREIRAFIPQEGSFDAWIQVGQRKTMMTLLNYPVQNQCYPSKGWIEFANDYNIVPGDVLIFDMLKLNELWMKTLIVKGVA